jgi:hypothetical protein
MKLAVSILLAVAGWSLILPEGLAQTAIWHCSKLSAVQAATHTSQATKVDTANDFTLAAYAADDDVISVSLPEILDVYSGRRVTLGHMELSACLLQGQNELTQQALNSLGINAATARILAKKNSLIQTNLFVVANEEQMVQCISRHFPSVGYLARRFENTEMAPCF